MKQPARWGDMESKEAETKLSEVDTAGIGVEIYFCPIHRQSADRKLFTEKTFMHEASRPSRYDAHVACIIKKADLLVWRDENATC